MKGSVKLPVFIDDARKYVNTTQLRAKYLGASYEAEYCQWQTLHGLGSLMETASLIITPNAYLEGKLIASYPPDPIGDFDVTRATTATRVNSAGLVELVPYNLVQYSEQFDNAYWLKTNTTITANVTTDPDGTQTADKLIGTVGSSSHRIGRTISDVSMGIAFTSSIYAKAGEVNILAYRDSTYGTVSYFNLSTGIVTPGVNHTCTITPIGNGWYRCSASVLNLYPNLVVNWCLNDFSATIGDGTSGLYLWGAQVDEGSTAKDYQKTETRLNIPRLNYSNGTCPSILVEPQRTNLNLFSEQFDNGAYSSAGGAGSGATFTTNYGIAPDGNQTADRFQITRGSNYWERYQRKTTTIGQVYTLSFWGKAVTGTPTLYTAFNNGYQNPVTFTNEWVRYTYTYTAAGTSTGFNLITWVNLAGTSATADVMVWGIQLEVGSYATSYIPTTSASVTRNADEVTKSGISALIGQTEGVAYIDFDFNSKITSNGVMAFSIDGGAGNEMYILIYSNGNIVWEMYNSGLVQGSITGNIGSFGRKKIALAYKLNDCALYSNGTLIGTDTAATIPAMSRVYLGRFYSSTAYNLSTGINSFVLWKTRLTNDQLTALTTI
jgi:hypothetical protein